MSMGKNIMLKKGKGKQYHLPIDNIEAVGKNIEWLKGKDISIKNIKIFKMRVGKNIKL